MKPRFQFRTTKARRGWSISSGSLGYMASIGEAMASSWLASGGKAMSLGSVSGTIEKPAFLRTL
jgi:hypothetical protein